MVACKSASDLDKRCRRSSSNCCRALSTSLKDSTWRSTSLGSKDDDTDGESGVAIVRSKGQPNEQVELAKKLVMMEVQAGWVGCSKTSEEAATDTQDGGPSAAQTDRCPKDQREEITISFLTCQRGDVPSVPASESAKPKQVNDTHAKFCIWLYCTVHAGGAPGPGSGWMHVPMLAWVPGYWFTVTTHSQELHDVLCKFWGLGCKLGTCKVGACVKLACAQIGLTQYKNVRRAAIQRCLPLVSHNQQYQWPRYQHIFPAAVVHILVVYSSPSLSLN